eukprot:scaffold27248_cov133-Isochrysis_galbana.AAC.1
MWPGVTRIYDRSRRKRSLRVLWPCGLWPHCGSSRYLLSANRARGGGGGGRLHVDSPHGMQASTGVPWAWKRNFFPYAEGSRNVADVGVTPNNSTDHTA